MQDFEISLEKENKETFCSVETVEYIETWKQIEGYSNYFISTRGRIWNSKRCRILSSPINSGGYPHVVLSKENKKTTFLVHQLVLKTFIGPCPIGFNVNHKDGNKKNNNISNLEYVTPSENNTHSYKIGTHPIYKGNRGKKWRTNIADTDVTEIRKLFNGGKHVKNIAQKFNISESGVYCLCSGRTWKDTFIQDVRQKTKITKTDIEKIKNLRKEGEKLDEIAKKFNISSVYVSRICSGKAKLVRIK